MKESISRKQTIKEILTHPLYVDSTEEDISQEEIERHMEGYCIECSSKDHDCCGPDSVDFKIDTNCPCCLDTRQILTNS